MNGDFARARIYAESAREKRARILSRKGNGTVQHDGERMSFRPYDKRMRSAACQIHGARPFGSNVAAIPLIEPTKRN